MHGDIVLRQRGASNQSDYDARASAKDVVSFSHWDCRSYSSRVGHVPDICYAVQGRNGCYTDASQAIKSPNTKTRSCMCKADVSPREPQQDRKDIWEED